MRFRRRSLLWAAAVLGSGGGALGCDPGSPPARLSPLTPMVRSAEEFADFYGICAQLNFLDTVYADHELALDLLAEIGVTQIRMRLDVRPEILDIIDSAAARGIRTQGIVGALGSVERPKDVLEIVRQRFAEPDRVFCGLENVNEPNTSTVPWVGETRQRAVELWDARNSLGLGGIPVIAPALARIRSGGVQGGDAAGQAAWLGDLSDVVDFGNMHVYPPRGGQPSLEIAEYRDVARIVCGDRPIMCTEGGYFTAALDFDGGGQAVPEAVAADYATPLMLEHLIAGQARFFRFELLDDGSYETNQREATFGMARVVDLPLLPPVAVPKLDLAPVRTLLDLLSDRGGAAPAQRVTNAQVSASPGTRMVWFERSDGVALGCAWVDAPLFDQTTFNVTAWSDRLGYVRVELDRPRSGRLHRLGRFVEVAQQDATSRWESDLGPGLTVLELRP